MEYSFKECAECNRQDKIFKTVHAESFSALGQANLFLPYKLGFSSHNLAVSMPFDIDCMDRISFNAKIGFYYGTHIFMVNFPNQRRAFTLA